jgi:hypothetical protein
MFTPICRQLPIVAALGMAMALAAPTARAQAEPKYQGFTLDEWIADLKDYTFTRREKAARVIAAIGPPAAKAVPALLQAYAKETDAEIRTLYLKALTAVGTPTAVDLPLLLKLSRREQESQVRALIIRMIDKVIAPADRFAPLLERGLKGDAELAAGVLEALARTPATTSGVAPKLLANAQECSRAP